MTAPANAPTPLSARILVVPGGTSVESVAMAHAALHKLVETWEEGSDAPSHMVVALRDPADVAPGSVRNSLREPSEVFPDIEGVDDPAFWDGIDLVVPTSGSSAGVPRLVGLSADALIASARATHEALSGPGRWILALPAHHIAGAQVLLRAAVAHSAPLIVDTSYGFLPKDLLRAITGATEDPDVPAYLSLVPTQLAACLEDPEVTWALARLSGVLVGGSHVDGHLLDRANVAGIPVHSTYGMTETAGGCFYDARPLPGVRARVLDPDPADGYGRLAIAGPMLMTRYLEGDSPFVDLDGDRWLATGDIGVVRTDSTIDIRGRADDVIVSGGLSIAPGAVRGAVLEVDGVRDAAVVGIPDDRWGQVVAALVTTIGEDGAPAFGPRVRDAVGEALGRQQAPRVVVVTDELPMLPSGKVDPGAVRTMVTSAVADGTAWVR